MFVAQPPTYNHVGFNYGDQYLGFSSHYKIEDDGVHHLKLRLLSSRDGLRFKYAGPDPYNRPALVDIGEFGDWDRFMCLMTGAPPIRVGDKLYIYYRGFSETHNRSGEKPKDSYYSGANGLATIRVDGFASVAAGFDHGRVTTKPFVTEGRTLLLNAKANHDARVAVDVLDESGKPIPGYTADDCVAMTTDNVEHAVSWQDRQDFSELTGRPVKLRFHLTNALLYAYRF